MGKTKNMNKRTTNIHVQVYIIQDSSVIFNRCFNEPLDNYYHIIRQYPTLVFNENLQKSRLEFFTASYYNMPIDLTKNLKNLIMSDSFNKSIFLSKQLVKIHFGYNFNKPLLLSKNLKNVCFGHEFNQMIGLVKNIKKFCVGNMFNHPLILSKNLVFINMGLNFNQRIDIPKCCVKLFLSANFNQPIILTKCLKNLEISCYYKHPLVIEKKLERLTIRKWNVMRGSVKILDNLPNKLLISLHITKITHCQHLTHNLPNDIESSGIKGLYYTTHKKSKRTKSII